MIPAAPDSGGAAGPTDGGDILYDGEQEGATLEGLQGDDVYILRNYSRNEPTTIVYTLGDGQDTVDAEYRNSAYQLQLNGIAAGDVRLLVSPGFSSVTGGDFPE